MKRKPRLSKHQKRRIAYDERLVQELEAHLSGSRWPWEDEDLLKDFMKSWPSLAGSSPQTLSAGRMVGKSMMLAKMYGARPARAFRGVKDISFLHDEVAIDMETADFAGLEARVMSYAMADANATQRLYNGWYKVGIDPAKDEQAKEEIVCASPPAVDRSHSQCRSQKDREGPRWPSPRYILGAAGLLPSQDVTPGASSSPSQATITLTPSV
jgi:hypothetical protein